MRLAVDVRTLLDPMPGGVETYTRSLLAGLSRSRDCTVIPVVTGRRRVRDCATVRFPLPNPLVNVSMPIARWPKLDLVAAADAYLLPNWNFLALKRTTSLTLVVHDLSFERNPSWYGWKQRAWHRAVQTRALVARASRIIAVSRWTKQDLTALYGVPGEKITVIYPVSDWSMLPANNAKVGETLLFFGTIEKRKNVLSVVRAFERIAARHPDANVVLAGRLGFGSAEVAAAVRRSSYSARIRLVGSVSAEARAALFRDATLFVCPSFYEGFGIPLLDALRHGLPVITADRSAMPEVVGDAGLLIDPYNTAELAEALSAVLGDAGFRAVLATRARARALHFPPSMAPALSEFFSMSM